MEVAATGAGVEAGVNGVFLPEADRPKALRIGVLCLGTVDRKKSGKSLLESLVTELALEGVGGFEEGNN